MIIQIERHVSLLHNVLNWNSRGISTDTLQMASVSHEYCAFTVAIVIKSFPRSSNIMQWSVESLVEEMKQIEMCEDHKFAVNHLALHPGLNIFKKNHRAPGTHSSQNEHWKRRNENKRAYGSGPEGKGF